MSVSPVFLADEVLQHRRKRWGAKVHFSPPIVRFQKIVKLGPPRLLADLDGAAVRGDVLHVDAQRLSKSQSSSSCRVVYRTR